MKKRRAYESKAKDKLRRLIIWLAFSVVFALGPLFVNFLVVRDSPNFAWTQLYDGGELFVASAVLCADAVGRLFHQGKPGFLVTVCLIGAVYILFASSTEFGMAAPGLRAKIPLTPKQEQDSLEQFVGTVLVGLASVIIE